jgi:superfamily II DNA or RNA helicase
MQGGEGIAYVGSSNLSASALQEGIEWNLRLVSSEDREAFETIAARFEALLGHPNVRRLSRPLVDAYALRVPVPPAPEARPQPKRPWPVQERALAALKKTRAAGNHRGLVVMATGLGKTYLAALDFQATGGERALFVAHREEILGQARDAWAPVFPEKQLGLLLGDQRDADAEILFASVQTLSRRPNLFHFREDHFDYIVVDEFHHAAAATYRRILGHFHPRFLLGLTATPDRLDGASLLDLCDGNLVFRCGLIEGIAQRHLVPFHYYGVKDEVDFTPIPWRSGRFDPEELTRALATERRAEQSLREYEKHRGPGAHRTLAFCCTTLHADYMADFFARRGHPAVAVHSGSSSAPRAESLARLREGSLEILCAVDVFNEGLDVPEIDTILMLRPTASPVVFLQQLGRGLRAVTGKERLTVVDFIGNHRSFLQKPQALVYLTGAELSGYAAVRKVAEGRLELPEGCHVEIETAALDLLAELTRVSREDLLVYEYLSFRDTHGRRPTAAELHGAGVHFKPIRERYESWFDFVAAQEDLEDDEARVLARHRAWFADLLRTPMTRSYKMVALQGLIDAGALLGEIDVEDSARRADEYVHRHLMLLREMREDAGRRVFGAEFERKWREMPLHVWAQGEGTSRPWFALEGDTFRSLLHVEPEDRTVFEAMTEELVELRLREHLDRVRRKLPLDAAQAPIELVVSHAGGRPILRFDRALRPDIPQGEVDVEVDGEPYRFRFVKIAVNVVTEPDGEQNVLPSLMRRWFGPSAGHPGTRHRVSLDQTEAGWCLIRSAREDESLAEVIPFPSIPFYEDLQVACGAFRATDRLAEASSRIQVAASRAPDPKRHFVVRASGDSMDGGERPIRDGDLVLCEWFEGGSTAELSGKPFLLVGHESADSSSAVIKVPRRENGRWLLESWNPGVPPFEIPPGGRIEPVARVLEVVSEATGLVLWGQYDRSAVARAFGGENDPSWQVGHRDVTLQGAPHTVFLVTLRKDDQTKPEHRYADCFVSRSELQWESQASTTPDSQKGRRIIEHQAEGRSIHLFVRYQSRESFLYCGRVSYLRHEGSTPMRVWFRLEKELPEGLWRVWGIDV